MGEAFRKFVHLPLSPREIEALRLLLSPGSSSRSFVAQWFSAEGVRIEADIELLMEFARFGFGTACV